MTYEHIELVQRINFGRLSALVNERIIALELYALVSLNNLDKAAESKALNLHDAICRDLVMENIYLLMEFVKNVAINEEKSEEGTP